MADLRTYARKNTVKLTTTGRKSGKRFTVSIWFVVEDESTILVQHVKGAPSNWYKNLAKNPSVQLDFGDGVLEAEARPITDASGIARVLDLIRKKHWFMAPFLQRGAKTPVAAAIRLR